MTYKVLKQADNDDYSEGGKTGNDENDWWFRI